MSEYIKHKESEHTQSKTLVIFISRMKTGEKNLNYSLFYKQHFYKQCQDENVKKSIKTEQQPETKL